MSASKPAPFQGLKESDLQAISATQQAPGNRAGASREMISNVLKYLDAGYIKMDAKRIVIAKSLPRDW